MATASGSENLVNVRSITQTDGSTTHTGGVIYAVPTDRYAILTFSIAESVANVQIVDSAVNAYKDIVITQTDNTFLEVTLDEANQIRRNANTSSLAVTIREFSKP